ncbi:enoyl-CoA delta isomerase 2 isoform X2 [Daktulosphaira vitifoliae]|uniref:enoyl-CoA delta isomerase 2 isoform X2 n=1 Tax=Daktulosphaira vitifoliae TaxID=58002 RepID=UPI0021A9F040|nr:enoyl-CoA delta isomerase 2 isoform X2 [Daktulosphaira vitifoliae]
MSTLLITYCDTIQTIAFNRPLKRNAISRQCYTEIVQALDEGKNNESVSVTLLTGVGKFYSSGTDLTDEYADRELSLTATNLVKAFIDYPKLLVALVNGPAIGIACTTLGLCDLVFAYKTATFTCPFHRLGLTAEGCSTITFPLIMGKLRATEFLYSGRTITAREAVEYGLVNEIIEDGPIGLDNLIKRLTSQIAKHKLPVIYTKSMILQGLISKKELHAANKRECERLQERFNSNDFHQSIIDFINRKDMKNKL